MKFKLTYVVVIMSAILTTYTNAQQDSLPILKGPYLGQKPPGEIPVKFAPGIVSTPEMEYRLVISPAGEDIFFCREEAIMHIRMKADKSGWENPTTAGFSGKYIDSEAWFSADGNRLYFTSRRPLHNSDKARNLWVTDKIDGTWGTAKPVPLPPADQTVHAVSIADNGNLYASGIIRFVFESGQYQSCRQLTPPVKGRHPCIAPDESFLIFSDRRVGGFDSDLYIIFLKSDGTWTGRISLGDRINTKQKESNASLSPDGEYLFFSRAEDIFWVKSDIIDSLRNLTLSE